MARLRPLGSLLCAVLLQATAAAADGPECARVRVDAAPDLATTWPELPDTVARTLATRPSVDTCAVVRLAKSERGIDIDVLLADGRAAARSVPSSDDVIPALEGLLLMPEPVPERRESSVVQREEPTPLPAPPARRPDPWLRDSTPPVGAPPSAVGFELSAITGLRAGDGPTSGSLGAVALLHAWDWLLAFDGRAHESHAASTLEVTLTVGHRFSPGAFELDVLVGGTTELPGPDAGPEEPLATDPAPRPNGEPWFHFASRLHLAPESTLGPFVGGEVLGGVIGPEDVGPEELQGEDVWMAGAVLGATVGTP